MLRSHRSQRPLSENKEKPQSHCESINNLIKLSTNWKACKLPDLVDRLHAIVILQLSEIKRALHNQGIYRSRGVSTFSSRIILSSIGNIVEHQITCRTGNFVQATFKIPRKNTDEGTYLYQRNVDNP